MWLENQNYLNKTKPIDQNTLAEQHPKDLYELVKNTFEQVSSLFEKALQELDPNFDARRSILKMTFFQDWAIWIATVNRALRQQLMLDLPEQIETQVKQIIFYTSTLNRIMRNRVWGVGESRPDLLQSKKEMEEVIENLNG